MTIKLPSYYETQHLPELSEQAKIILEKRYLLRDKNGNLEETPYDMFYRVANAAASNETEFQEVWKNEFFYIMANLDFMPNSPVLMNLGTDKGCGSACFVLNLNDSMEDILQVARDAVMIEKYGGGVGFSLTDLRPEGYPIATTHGKACGPVAVLKYLSAGGDLITQAGKRSGAHMAVMSVYHPDIVKFIKCKTTEGDIANFNISVAVDANFMDAVDTNSYLHLQWPLNRDICYEDHDGVCVSARWLFELIVENAWRNGEPGMVWLDRMNDDNYTPNLGEIKATNPCLSGNTKIWTIYGPRTFKELAEIGCDVPVLSEDDDGNMSFQFMRNPRMTQEYADTIIVTVKSARNTIDEIVVTSDHPMILSDGSQIRAKNLQIGDSLASVYRHKANSKGYLKLSNRKQSDMEHRIVVSHKLGRKPNYPTEHCNHIDENKQNNHPDNLEVLSSRYHNALNMFGNQNPSVRFVPRPQSQSRPLSQNGQWRDDVDRQLLIKDRNNGMKLTDVAVKYSVSLSFVKREVAKFKNHRVIDVGVGPRIPVYNGTVDNTHRYVIDLNGHGVVVHNCGEEPLLHREQCCLGSINLANFIVEDNFDWNRLGETIETAVRFLDNVIDVQNYATKEIEEMNKQTRKIGLGVMGWADALIKMNIPYDSVEALDLIDKLMKYFQETALETSELIGAEKGNFLAFESNKTYYSKHKNMRNTWVMSIAPTGTISMIADCSFGIEPLFALSYKKHNMSAALADEEFEFVNDELVERFLNCCVGNSMVVDQYPPEDMLRHLGEDAAKIFVTANQIEPFWHVLHQGRFQAYVDAGVSKTINLPNTATQAEVADIYKRAYYEGCKGITVYREGSRKKEVIVRTDKTENKEVQQKKQRPQEMTGITQKVNTAHG